MPKGRVVPQLEIKVLSLLLTGEYRPSEIAGKLNISRTGFMRVVPYLMEKGLIDKRMVVDETYPHPSITDLRKREGNIWKRTKIPS